MKNFIFYTSFLIFSFSRLCSYAQSQNAYSGNINAAKHSSDNKNYLEAARFYSKAFLSNNNLGRIDHRYSAAKCWALAGEPDSAFYQLEKIVKAGYREYLEILTDAALMNLRNDPRWPKTIDMVKENMRRAEETSNSVFKNLKTELIPILDTIYIDDQLYRRSMNEVEQRFGINSKEMDSQISLIARHDSLNIEKVKVILDTYGWLGKEDIGEKGATTLFLVLQHSSLPRQLKYFPIFKKAVEQGKAEPADLALLEDRIALKQGKKQIYGSQVAMNKKTGRYYVQPLESPEDVDIRRSKVGLAPIKDYVSQWGIEWSIEQYKRDLKLNSKN